MDVLSWGSRSQQHLQMGVAQTAKRSSVGAGPRQHRALAWVWPCRADLFHERRVGLSALQAGAQAQLSGRHGLPGAPTPATQSQPRGQ